MDLENGHWTSRILEFHLCEGQKPLETSGKRSDHRHQQILKISLNPLDVQILETSLTPLNGRIEETSSNHLNEQISKISTKHFHGEFQGKVAFHL